MSWFSSLTIKGCVCLCVSHTILHHHPTLLLFVRIKYLNVPNQGSDSDFNHLITPSQGSGIDLNIEIPPVSPLTLNIPRPLLTVIYHLNLNCDRFSIYNVIYHIHLNCAICLWSPEVITYLY